LKLFVSDKGLQTFVDLRSDYVPGSPDQVEFWATGNLVKMWPNVYVIYKTVQLKSKLQHTLNMIGRSKTIPPLVSSPSSMPPSPSY